MNAMLFFTITIGVGCLSLFLGAVSAPNRESSKKYVRVFWSIMTVAIAVAMLGVILLGGFVYFSKEIIDYEGESTSPEHQLLQMDTSADEYYLAKIESGDSTHYMCFYSDKHDGWVPLVVNDASPVEIYPVIGRSATVTICETKKTCHREWLFLKGDKVETITFSYVFTLPNANSVLEMHTEANNTNETTRVFDSLQ